jgi:hypothetical protein
MFICVTRMDHKVEENKQVKKFVFITSSIQFHWSETYQSQKK